MGNYVIVGNPVVNSSSPEIYNYLFNHFGIAGNYTRLLLNDVHHFRPLFDLLPLSGCNITMPHKQSAFSIADEHDFSAAITESANTLTYNGKLKSFNTDYLAFQKLLNTNGKLQTGGSALVIGSGNTANTVIRALRKFNIEISLLNRTKINSEILKSEFPEINVIETNEIADSYDLLVNAIPDTSFLFDSLRSKKFDTVVDFNYIKNELLYLKNNCSNFIDGYQILISQALFAFDIYTDNRFELVAKQYDNILPVLHSKISSPKAKKSNIVLVGFTGTGKTEIGRALANKLGKSFADTDELISQREGKSINDIFATHGESYFRHLESKIASELSLSENMVIATGGGFIENPSNISLLRDNSFIIWLFSDLTDSLERTDISQKPKLIGHSTESIKKLFDSRLDKYFKTADLIYFNKGNREAAIEVLYGELSKANILA